MLWFTSVELRGYQTPSLTHSHVIPISQALKEIWILSTFCYSWQWSSHMRSASYFCELHFPLTFNVRNQHKREIYLLLLFDFFARRDICWQDGSSDGLGNAEGRRKAIVYSARSGRSDPVERRLHIEDQLHFKDDNEQHALRWLSGSRPTWQLPRRFRFVLRRVRNMIVIEPETTFHVV